MNRKLSYSISCFLLLLGVLLCSCNRDDVPTTPTDCVEFIKTENELYLCPDGGAFIDEYLFQGETVFLYSPGACCCDFSDLVYNNECIALGQLRGILGSTEIGGVPFYTNSIFQVRRWEQ